MNLDYEPNIIENKSWEEEIKLEEDTLQLITYDIKEVEYEQMLSRISQANIEEANVQGE